MAESFGLCLSGHDRFDGLTGLSPAVTDTSPLGEQLKPVCLDGLTITLTQLTITLTAGERTSQAHHHTNQLTTIIHKPLRAKQSQGSANKPTNNIYDYTPSLIALMKTYKVNEMSAKAT